MLVSRRPSTRRLIRFEKKVTRLWESGRIHVPVHLSGGNEDTLIRLFSQVRYGDYVLATHRNHYHALLAGVSQRKIINELLGRENGLCSAHAGSMGLISAKHRFYASAIVAGLCATAAGLGLALREKRLQTHVWCFVGDGATDEGAFYESVRYVSGHKLPVTYIIEDNDRSVTTDNDTRWGEAGPWICQAFPCVRYYQYKASSPHVGTGKFVSF